MRRLRGQFETAADMMVDRLVERGRFDAIAELVEEYPLTVFPDAMGMSRENRRFLLPFRNMVFNSFGPANEFFRDAVEDAAPVLVWLQQQMQRDARAPGDQQETSVLLVEQNARYALETAARGYVLQTGTIIASGASS
jgi:ABC-type lipopolysaccharide export system ATPase subunit